MQVKLFRVLQERVVTRVGGTRDISVDVRVICATSRNLGKMVEDGLFREDLYFRINVFPIELPPLRARHDDIPILIRHFTDKLPKLPRGLRSATVSNEADKLLRAYSWPGNVRELENAIERGLVLAGGREIKPSMLPPDIAGCPTTKSKLVELAASGVPIDEALIEFSFAPALAVPHVVSPDDLWLQQVRPPEILIVDDFQPNIEVYNQAAPALGALMARAVGGALDGVKVIAVHPDELAKDVRQLAHRLRTCVLLVLDLHFDDGVKSWTNGYELLAYAVEAAPWLGEAVLFVTQTGHDPQRTIYYARACEAIRQLEEFGASRLRVLDQIEPEVYPIEIDSSPRRLVPSFGEHSQPEHRQWWWGLRLTMERLLRRRLNAMESWLIRNERGAKTSPPTVERGGENPGLADAGGAKAHGANSGNLLIRRRESSGGPLLVADAVQWIVAKVTRGSQTKAILKAFRAAWNVHAAELRPVLSNQSWKTQFFDELSGALMEMGMQRTRTEDGPADEAEIKQRVRGGWTLWCNNAVN